VGAAARAAAAKHQPHAGRLGDRLGEGGGRGRKEEDRGEETLEHGYTLMENGVNFVSRS
jgi:hypothetical protein